MYPAPSSVEWRKSPLLRCVQALTDHRTHASHICTRAIRNCDTLETSANADGRGHGHGHGHGRGRAIRLANCWSSVLATGQHWIDSYDYRRPTFATAGSIAPVDRTGSSKGQRRLGIGAEIGACFWALIFIISSPVRVRIHPTND